MRYNSELDVKEVALQLIGQIPEITMFAKVALEDAAKAYEGILASNSRSMEGLHDLDMAMLAALRNELAKDLTHEERMRILDEIGELHERAYLKDSENKKFLGEQFEKRLGITLSVAAAVVVVVVGVTKSGGKSSGSSSYLKAA